MLVACDQILGYFTVEDRTFRPTLRLSLIAEFDARPWPDVASEKWALLGETDWLTCYVCGEQYFYQSQDNSQLLLDLAAGCGCGWIDACASADAIQRFCQRLWLPALATLLCTRGLFPLHAAAARHTNGGGALIVGQSGQGKSTLLLHLLQQGWRYLGDDVVFIRRTRAAASELLACPAQIRARPEILRFLPELQPHLTALTPDVDGKFRLNGWLTARTAAPRLVLLPEVVASVQSSVVPISRAAAAVACFTDNLLVSSHPLSAAQFALIAQYIQQAACYAIQLGQDMSRVAHLIQEIW